MVLKFINSTEARVGTNILLEGEPYTVKKIDISKTGKHGHAKARIEAVGIINGNKKVFVLPGHDRLEVPEVNKNKGQILSITENNASVMDSETFETYELEIPEELKSEIEENSTVEYWNIEGQRIIKRKL